MKDSQLIIELKKTIDNHDIISFDIFDTLLLRPYCKSIDLFKHLEESQNVPLFYHKRIQAEISARKKIYPKEGITIDDIYEQIEEKFNFLKEFEVAYEMQTLKRNPEIFQVYKYAISQKKKILFVSDIYLHMETIVKILEKNGYTKYNKIYTSSNYKKTKQSGNLFREVLKEHDFGPSQILHIGDNYETDIEAVKKCGIKAYYYPKILKRFKDICVQKNDYKILKFMQSYNSSGGSILIKQMAIDTVLKGKSWDKDYWELLGKYYGGTLAYTYCNFIKKTALEENVSEVIFIARDGYNLKKIYDLIKQKEIKTHYLYSPRIFTEISFFALKLLNGNRKKTEKKLGKIFGKGKSNKKFIREQSIYEFSKIKNYFNKFNFGDNIMIIDSVTGGFSSQKLFENIFPDKKVLGCYWHVLDAAISLKKDFNFKTFIAKESESIKYWDIFEFLITSPELPIRSINENGTPKFIEENEFENHRIILYRKISLGIIDFVDEMINNFNKTLPFFSKEDIVYLIDLFCSHPTVIDKKMFSGVYVSRDSDNKIYNPLMIATKEDKIKADSFGLRTPPWNIKAEDISYGKSRIGSNNNSRINILNILKIKKIKKAEHERLKVKILGVNVYQKDVYSMCETIRICNIIVNKKNYNNA